MSTTKKYDRCSSCMQIFGYYQLLDNGICIDCHRSLSEKKNTSGGHFVAEQRQRGTLMTWKEDSPRETKKCDQCSSCKQIFGYYELLDTGICADCYNLKRRAQQGCMVTEQRPRGTLTTWKF